MANGSWAHRERKRAYAKLSKEIATDKINSEFEFKRSISRSKKIGARNKEIDTDFVLKMMDSLSPGDSMSVFGLPDIVVKKVNKRSITDTNGERWSIADLVSLL